MPPKQDLATIWQQALTSAEAAEFRGEDVHAVLATVSNAADTMIRKLVDSKQAANDFAVCAVGGFGRRQLHPHSDIDLLFLHPVAETSAIGSIAEKVLYGLWDLGLKVGHAARSVSECIKLGQADVTIRTNLLDLRFIAGSRQFFDAAASELERQLLHQRLGWFAKEKIKELEARRRRYGDIAYLLEPNVKESPGGLRDLQTAYWISKSAFRCLNFSDLFPLGVLASDDAHLLDKNFAMLLRIRNRLHFRSHKPTDQITLQAQRDIAHNFAYTDSATELGSEAFMRNYYELSRETRQTVDVALETFLDRIEPPARSIWFRRKRNIGNGFYRYRDRIVAARSALESAPHLQIQAYRLAQQEGVPLSVEVKKVLRELAPNLQAATSEDWRQVATELLAILRQPQRLFETLNELNEIGSLRVLFSEFEHLYCRVQHDTYHIYTADQHLFVCVRILSKLLSGEFRKTELEIHEIAARIGDQLTIVLAVLLHDIGKGYGVDHSQKGAEIARSICGKLGLPQPQIDTVCFLVKEHLLLSHTAQRRDLSDHRVIQAFASHIPDVAALDLLLVLTFCDQNGVGPGVWTAWKRSLMLQLYDATKRELEREDIQGVYRDRIELHKEKLKRDLADEFDTEVLAKFLDAMPPRFYVRHEGVLLAEVVRSFIDGQSAGVSVRVISDPETGGRVILGQPDYPGVFAFQAGLFAACDLSIVDAEGYTVPEFNWAANLFYVKSLDPLFFQQPERIISFKGKILDWLKHPDNARQIVRRKLAEPRPEKPHSRRRMRVKASIDSSGKYTVFEVFAWDRIGLLHELSTTFTEERCNIWLARIHTEGLRVSDIFYVQGQEGGPIEDAVRIQDICDKLYTVINS